MSPALPYALLLFACLVAPAAARDDEIVEEFKRYFKRYEDTPTRVEAVLSLSGSESTAVVDALVPVLDLDEEEVVQAAVRVLGGFKTRPPVERMLAVLPAYKDTRVRLGLLMALRDGAYPELHAGLSKLLADSAWEIRRGCIEALVASPGGSGVDAALAPACADPEPAVRCAALDGLAALGSQLVLAPARSALADESWQVRASAIHALGRVRHRDSIGPLIERMAEEQGRLVEDIGRTLAALTGRDFGVRLEGWQGFWNTWGERFVLPTDEELARLAAARAKSAEQYEARAGSVEYHGIQTPSRSILFVIDVSGSMEQEVKQKERFLEGDYPSFQRIDIVKTELVRTIEGLEPYVKFNVLAFATEVDPWKKALVPANVLNKSSATSWVRRLEAIGGPSQEDLAIVGLTGTADLEAGKTNTFAALDAALSAAGKGARERDDYAVEVDTIFFLSDGRPSHGRYTEPDDILREVREANALRKVVIHTISLGEFEEDFMRRLAEENGGVYVDLGH
jgi:HEAT repeat protein